MVSNQTYFHSLIIHDTETFFALLALCTGNPTVRLRCLKTHVTSLMCSFVLARSEWQYSLCRGIQRCPGRFIHQTTTTHETLPNTHRQWERYTWASESLIGHAACGWVDFVTVLGRGCLKIIAWLLHYIVQSSATITRATITRMPV